MPVIRIGTRRSRLALWQTAYVCTALKNAWPALTVQVIEITTEGDRLAGALDGGGKGLFTSALEEAMVERRIDLAVHSLKDLPTGDREGLKLGAILGRATARDVLLSGGGQTVDTLPPGGKVGTSSRRRRAQLRAYRPDLRIVPIRGNVDTRIRKLQAGNVDALVLAQAGLQRLSIAHPRRAILPLAVMLPAPGQGALAVQCREDCAVSIPLLQAVDCARDRRATTAERTFLAALGGGCAAPIAAYAHAEAAGPITMQAMVASPEGDRVIRVQGEDAGAQSLGLGLAEEALRLGAGEVLRAA